MEILLFTRFPIPGQAKTRLIPAIGPERASDLHRRLAERMAATLRSAREELACGVRVCHTGAPEADFRTWLGEDLPLEVQADGDLGQRLLHAIEASFARGHSKTLLIGSDCPELSTRHFRAAFDALDQHRLVTGPAEDGGYYLLGLTPPAAPCLFENIDWGAPTVLAETLTTADKTGLTHTELETLHDIDLPSDLPQLDPLGISH